MNRSKKNRKPLRPLSKPETPALLLNRFEREFSKLVKARLHSLVSELMVHHREDALSPLEVTIQGLVVRYGERLFTDLGPLFTRLITGTNQFNLGQMQLLWQQMLGLPYVDSADMARLVAGYQKQNLALIKTLADTAVTRVKRVLVDNQGKPAKTVAKAMEEAVGVSSSHARLLARDQVLKLNGQLTQQRHAESGITKYEWSTSEDSRVRSEHASLDGQTFDWDDPPITSEDGRKNHPGGDYQCRCVAIPIIDL